MQGPLGSTTSGLSVNKLVLTQSPAGEDTHEHVVSSFAPAGGNTGMLAASAVV